jgi:hypothetical protein
MEGDGENISKAASIVSPASDRKKRGGLLSGPGTAIPDLSSAASAAQVHHSSPRKEEKIVVKTPPHTPASITRVSAAATSSESTATKKKRGSGGGRRGSLFPDHVRDAAEMSTREHKSPALADTPPPKFSNDNNMGGRSEEQAFAASAAARSRIGAETLLLGGATPTPGKEVPASPTPNHSRGSKLAPLALSPTARLATDALIASSLDELLPQSSPLSSPLRTNDAVGGGFTTMTTPEKDHNDDSNDDRTPQAAASAQDSPSPLRVTGTLLSPSFGGNDDDDNSYSSSSAGEATNTDSSSFHPSHFFHVSVADATAKRIEKVEKAAARKEGIENNAKYEYSEKKSFLRGGNYDGESFSASSSSSSSASSGSFSASSSGHDETSEKNSNSNGERRSSSSIDAASFFFSSPRSTSSPRPSFALSSHKRSKKGGKQTINNNNNNNNKRNSNSSSSKDGSSKPTSGANTLTLQLQNGPLGISVTPLFIVPTAASENSKNDEGNASRDTAATSSKCGGLVISNIKQQHRQYNKQQHHVGGEEQQLQIGDLIQKVNAVYLTNLTFAEASDMLAASKNRSVQIKRSNELSRILKVEQEKLASQAIEEERNKKVRVLEKEKEQRLSSLLEVQYKQIQFEMQAMMSGNMNVVNTELEEIKRMVIEVKSELTYFADKKSREAAVAAAAVENNQEGRKEKDEEEKGGKSGNSSEKSTSAATAVVATIERKPETHFDVTIERKPETHSGEVEEAKLSAASSASSSSDTNTASAAPASVDKSFPDAYHEARYNQYAPQRFSSKFAPDYKYGASNYLDLAWRELDERIERERPIASRGMSGAADGIMSSTDAAEMPSMNMIPSSGVMNEKYKSKRSDSFSSIKTWKRIENIGKDQRAYGWHSIARKMLRHGY